MGDEIMKAYTCGARAAFDGPPEKCPVRKGSKCRVSEPMLDCDAEPIYVYPKARHAATQAALAAAGEALEAWDEIRAKTQMPYPDLLFGTHYKPIVRKHNKALKLIRDAKGAEDD